MDSLFQVDRLLESAVGLLFCGLPLLVFVSLCDTETLCSHSPPSAFLTSAIKDDYGSSAVLELVLGTEEEATGSLWVRIKVRAGTSDKVVPDQ